jgi:hypothetical protein
MQVETNEGARLLVFASVKLPLADSIYEMIEAVKKLPIESQNEIIADAGLEIRADVSTKLTLDTAMSIVQDAWFAQLFPQSSSLHENHAIRLRRYEMADPTIVRLTKRPRKAHALAPKNHASEPANGFPHREPKHGASLRALIAEKPNLTRGAARRELAAATALPVSTTDGAVKPNALLRSGVRVNPATKFLELIPKFEENAGMSLREAAEVEPQPLKKSDFSANDQWAFRRDETPEQFLARTGKADPRL